jgi:hypothetical protein
MRASAAYISTVSPLRLRHFKVSNLNPLPNFPIDFKFCEGDYVSGTTTLKSLVLVMSAVTVPGGGKIYRSRDLKKINFSFFFCIIGFVLCLNQ